MGFELLPVTDGDEDLYDIFTVTCSDKWNPHEIHINPNDYDRYYDPSDTLVSDSDYPASLNHLSLLEANTGDNDPQDDPDCHKNDYDCHNVHYDVTNMSQSLMESYVLATATWHRVIHKDIDPALLRPYLGWRPLKIVKRTLARATQMARMIIRQPLRRHVKARFPHLNVTRIDEPVSIDPMFSNCRSIHHGFTAAQVFFGTKSHTSFVYGIRSKGEFPKVYKDFIRDHGAPSALRRDNAKEEQSEVV